MTCSLANNVLRLLVLAQRDELGMSQVVLRRPFKKLELPHQDGLQPLALSQAGVPTRPPGRAYPHNAARRAIGREPKRANGHLIEPHDFDRVLAALEPPAYAAAAEMAFITGWRLRSEVLTPDVPTGRPEGRDDSIDVGVTKGGEGRTFPITKRLREILKKRRKQDVTSATLVFHEEDASAIHYKHFYARWHAACAVAKVKGLIPHDLRRSAVREMERRRIPRQVSMKLVGHRTESIYRRYAIVSDADIREAGAQLDQPVAHQANNTFLTQSTKDQPAKRRESRRNTR